VIFLYSVPRLMGRQTNIAKNNKYFQRRYELLQFIDYFLQNNHCNIHAAFLHHSNALFHIHSLCLSIVMSIRFQGKLLWSTKSNPTDYCYDRTYMVVVMQLNVCHESPVTQSDIGSPDMEGFHLFTRQEGQRGGAVSRGMMTSHK
jgi:hypothetical protein